MSSPTEQGRPAHWVIDIETESRFLGDAGRKVHLWGLAAAGVGLALAAVVAFQTGGRARLLWSYLANYTFFLSLALGALFWVLLERVTHAGWSVVLRRLAEGVAANLPLLGGLALPLVLGARTIYRWTLPAATSAHPALAGKTAYLNLPFFTLRLVIYFAVWGGLAGWFFRRSVAQDATGDSAATRTIERWAPLGMVLFALTTTFASFDLLMSLDPHWFSTVFGVYYFSGSVVGFLALLTVGVLLVQRSGRLTRAITAEHYHDVGKLLFAFVVFWAYIGFSQFMLIWYGNLPEETIWYQRRLAGGWGIVALVLLFGHFFGPFIGLLGRSAKRRPAILASVAAWLLLMHWLDVYWMAMPEMNPGARGVVPLHLADLAVFLMLGGVLLAQTARRLSHCSLIAEGDPRLQESLAFENV